MRLPLARKKVPCHDRVCAFSNIRIEEFTSPLSEHKHLPSTSFWLNVTSRALSRFRSTGWSNFVTSRRTASRLLSAVRPSTRIQCPCKANGGSGTAVNYPLYTALDLEPIFNDLSNLARGEKRGKGRGEWWDSSSPLAPRSAENSRGARGSRNNVNDDGENGIEDEETMWDRPGRFPRIIWYSNVPAT